MSDTNGSAHTLPDALLSEFARHEEFESRRIDVIDERLAKLAPIPDLLLRLMTKVEENTALQRASAQAIASHGAMLEAHSKLLDATVDTVSKAVTLLGELVEAKPTAEQLARRRRK